MTRVDFYLLPEAGQEARYRFACRLTEKAYKLGKRVYLLSETDDEAARLDELLWTFRAGSFVPHAVVANGAEMDVPVLIGHVPAPASEHEVLINLSRAVPAFSARFERVVELVDDEPVNKQAARERFRLYKERGYQLETHQL